MMNDFFDEAKKYRIPLVLAVSTIVLGAVGFLLEAGAWTGIAAFEKMLYKSVQLFQVEFDPDQHGNLFQNPALFLARWLGTTTTIWIIAAIYIRFLRQNAKIKKARRWKGHSIVCGYGEIGKRIVKSLLDNGSKVVIIDPGMEREKFPLSDERNCVLVPQDASTSAALERAGMRGARYLFAVTGNDILNINILSDAKLMCSHDKKHGALLAYSHIDNYELLHDLQDYPLFQLEEPYFDAHLFNADDISARLIFKEHAPDIYQPVVSKEAPPLHILVAGMEKPAQALITELARSCHFLSQTKTRITVVEENAEDLEKVYMGHFPRLREVVDFKTVSCRPDCLDDQLLDQITHHNPVHVAYIYHQDRTVQTLAMSRFKQYFEEETAIVLCQQEDTALPDYATKQNNIFSATAFQKATHFESIIEAPIESLAKMFHEQYLIDQNVDLNSTAPRSKRAYAPWHQLPEELKQSNRSLAAHVDVKLRALGLAAAPLSNTPTESIGAFNKKAGFYAPENQRIALLANMEHRRWNADRFIAGWKYGTPRNDDLKIHDKLVDWDELDDETKEYDVDAILAIRDVLKKNGMGIYKRSDL